MKSLARLAPALALLAAGLAPTVADPARHSPFVTPAPAGVILWRPGAVQAAPPLDPATRDRINVLPARPGLALVSPPGGAALGQGLLGQGLLGQNLFTPTLTLAPAPALDDPATHDRFNVRERNAPPVPPGVTTSLHPDAPQFARSPSR